MARKGVVRQQQSPPVTSRRCVVCKQRRGGISPYLGGYMHLKCARSDAGKTRNAAVRVAIGR